jgi:ribosomal protein S8
MRSRFPSMISILKAHSKHGSTSCDAITNSLGIRVLRLFREQGFIHGFSIVSPRGSNGGLYPRVRIFLKHTESRRPIIVDLRLYKNSRANTTNFTRKPVFTIAPSHKFYLISGPHGLRLTSMTDYYGKRTPFKGNILLYIII